MKNLTKTILKHWALVSVIAVLGFVYIPAKVTVEYKEVPLTVVLSDISKQSKMDLAYSGTYVDLNSKVSVSMKNASVSDVLQVILENTSLDYIVQNDKIYITNKDYSNPENKKGKDLTKKI